MKRAYEITVIFRIDPSEEVMAESMNQVKAWIEADDHGTITKIDTTHWGRRRLTYEIDRQKEGLYALMYVDMEPEGLDELERNLKLAPDILRYLIVRPD